MKETVRKVVTIVAVVSMLIIAGCSGPPSPSKNEVTIDGIDVVADSENGVICHVYNEKQAQRGFSGVSCHISQQELSTYPEVDTVYDMERIMKNETNTVCYIYKAEKPGVAHESKDMDCVYLGQSETA